MGLIGFDKIVGELIVALTRNVRQREGLSERAKAGEGKIGHSRDVWGNAVLVHIPL